MVMVDPVFSRRNLITDFSLYCQNREMSSVVQSQLFLGNIVGSFAMCLIGVGMDVEAIADEGSGGTEEGDGV